MTVKFDNYSDYEFIIRLSLNFKENYFKEF